MKISFWSNVRGTAGVTTNLACVSALTSISGQGKSVLLENHYSMQGIGDILLLPEKIGRLREEGEYFSHYGIEYVLKRLYSGEKADKLVHHATIPLLFSTMYYLPQAKIVNKEVFAYEFNLVQENLFDALSEISDYIFIDTETNQNLSSSVILSKADMVVVNLDQNPVHLKEYFTNYTSIREKAVYLIGNYKPELPWDVGKICKEFHIPKDKIGIIPFNMELHDAMLQGHLLQYLNRNYYKPSDMENEYFIRYAKRASQMVRKNILRVRKGISSLAQENVRGYNEINNVMQNG
ncbi:MAG: hypothetical protein SO170_10750 [Butyribacter sp.]|nr:hypothetical protein [bacterium]MDY3855413.1 hypothetical protein [Butyribacter sp.]